MNSSELNILTLEDPVEYQLQGITQTQVSDKKGLSFAKGLRALVRQDPDIIMVGEIRDLETASVAIQSALTGHLVLSTLHTNDAPSSVTRLLDLGVEPYLAASSLNAVIAQRLVRRICPQCCANIPFVESTARNEGLSTEECEWFRQQKVSAVTVGSGCEACYRTGFSGRTGIHELMFMSESIRSLIHTRSPASVLKKAAIEGGMFTLRQNGLLKVAAGITTLQEVYHATQMDL
jgi:general secretion pathway protein E